MMRCLCGKRAVVMTSACSLAACAEIERIATPLEDRVIRVAFSGDCPTSVYPAVPSVRRHERIRRQSVSGPQVFAVHAGLFLRRPLPSIPEQGRTLWTKVELNPQDFDVDERIYLYDHRARVHVRAEGAHLVQ